MEESLSVEIFWPSALPPGPALEAQSELETAGVPTTCRLQPARRGPEAIALVVLTSPVVMSFLDAVFSKFAAEAYQALRSFVHRLLKSSPTAALHSVVFEASNGARVVFTPGLPIEAFQQALAIDAGDDGGVWTWDPAHHQWLSAH